MQLAFLIVEVAGGFAFHSLALLSDAAHMLADVAALALALGAAHLATGRPVDTEGHSRPEVYAAVINAAMLLVSTAVIAFEAFRRLAEPQEVIAGGTLAVAVAGLAANLVTALVLMRADQDNLNIRASLAHTITDAVSSVGVILVALAIAATGTHVLDPVASLAIAVIVGRMGLQVWKDSTAALSRWEPTSPVPLPHAAPRSVPASV